MVNENENAIFNYEHELNYSDWWDAPVGRIEPPTRSLFDSLSMKTHWGVLIRMLIFVQSCINAGHRIVDRSE